MADAASDTDADGLIDLEEYYHQTDPNNEDTDGDGVKDKEEIAVGSDPRKAPKPPADDPQTGPEKPDPRDHDH